MVHAIGMAKMYREIVVYTTVSTTRCHPLRCTFSLLQIAVVTVAHSDVIQLVRLDAGVRSLW